MQIARLLGMGWTSLVLLACNSQGVKTDTPAKVETEEEKILYALGLAIAQNSLEPFKGQFSDAEMAVIMQGFADAVKGGETIVPLQEFGPKINPMLQERLQRAQAQAAEEGKAFREKAAQEEGAVQTASGLIFKELNGRHRGLA